MTMPSMTMPSIATTTAAVMLTRLVRNTRSMREPLFIKLLNLSRCTDATLG